VPAPPASRSARRLALAALLVAAAAILVTEAIGDWNPGDWYPAKQAFLPRPWACPS